MINNHFSTCLNIKYLPSFAVLLSVVGIYLSIIFNFSLTITTWVILFPVFLIILRLRRYKLFDKSSLIVICIVCLIFIITQLLGRNFVILDCGITLIVSFLIFANTFNSKEILFTNFIFLRKFYQLFTTFILLELLLIFLDFSSVLAMIKGYHLGNRADLITYFKIFNDFNAPDTIFLGRQIAGTLALSSCIIFFYSKFKNRLVWIMLSIFLFIFSATGIVLVISFLVLSFAFFRLKFGKEVSLIIKTKKIILFFLFFILVIISFDFIVNSFFSRALSTDTIVSGLSEDDPGNGLTVRDYYLFSFLLPLYQLLYEQSIISILFGAPTEYLLNPNIFFAGDFGFGFNLLRGGILIGFILLFYFLKYIWISVLVVRRNFLKNQIFSLFKPLILTNLIFILSQIHYINIQATVFFSFQFSLLVSSFWLYKKNKLI